jgi:hypothetical protein
MATAGAGLHTFVTTTGSLAVTGTAAAAEDLMAVSGALDFGQRVEFHVSVFRLGAESLDLFEGTELGETVQGGLDDSLGIVGSHGFRKDILVASDFKHGTDATASDEAGTGSSRTEHHDAAVGVADDFVRDGVATEIDANEGAVGAVGSFADCIRNFLGLAVTHTDAALAITCHDERGKVEATAAFDDLRAAVDVDDLVVEFGSRGVVAIVATRTATRAARAIATAAGTTRATGTTTITARAGTTRTTRGRRGGGGGGGSRGGGVFCAHEIRRSGRPGGRLRRRT